jgi:hypothetical protein
MEDIQPEQLTLPRYYYFRGEFKLVLYFHTYTVARVML